MDADAEEIWKDRLTKDIDVDKVRDKQSLLKEIDTTPNSYTTKTGKVVSLTKAKENLKTFVDDLMTSDSLQNTIVSNTVTEVEKTTNITTVSTIRKRDRNIEQPREREVVNATLLRETELNREGLFDLVNTYGEDFDFSSLPLRNLKVDVSDSLARQIRNKEVDVLDLI